MRWLIGGAAAVAGGMVARRLLGGAGRGSDQWQRVQARRHGARWHVATVNRPAGEVAPGGRFPEPLAGLGDAVEVQVRPAPGGRGTEIAVRLRDGARLPAVAAARRVTGRDPDQAIRAALRESKQLIETSEVLHPDYPPTTEPTPVNKPLRMATQQGRREGRL
ncbi:hypothetical protein O7631_27040 [Micromonospora sp. WMMD967]|uniref:hypothetical protein n=1 Tax=Micromonospora sp. WMMD967 TaxID=3016101 RepID=UPI002416F157|nr:hypothetical protein [Micromonospora sp. WMMD967]MDG4840204.1 hypothetical protein [Micromonospora sp. WMMD967]